MDGAGIYLAPLLNLPPRGAYSDAKQVVQQLNLLNARGANMVIYGILMGKAEELAKALGKLNWSCSVGWLDRFKKRHSITWKSMSGERAAVAPG